MLKRIGNYGLTIEIKYNGQEFKLNNENPKMIEIICQDVYNGGIIHLADGEVDTCYISPFENTFVVNDKQFHIDYDQLRKELITDILVNKETFLTRLSKERLAEMEDKSSVRKVNEDIIAALEAEK